MERPKPFFHKRNSTRVVVNRTPISVTSTTTSSTTVRPKVSRKSVRRKVTRTSVATTSKSTAPTTTATQKSQIIDEIFDTTISIPLTTATPQRTFFQTSQRTPQKQSLYNQLGVVHKNDPNDYDKILEHQYKIKGIDASSEETYEDEKLIGVLGSQVSNIYIAISL